MGVAFTMNINIEYHYSPELFNILVDTIPRLNRSKPDVITFFEGAGVSQNYIKDLQHRVIFDRQNIDKYEITRTVLQRINEKGDSELRVRREVLKRVIEFENFSACWPDDQLKAKGLVSEIRQLINVKDSFTRINQEREREREERIKKQKEKAEKERIKNLKIEEVKKSLYSLFTLDNQPQQRGKLLEGVLNDLFEIYGILVREDFRRKSMDEGTGVIEQVDGIIELQGHSYYVEMKWEKEPIGVAKISQHLVRIFCRPEARAIFISASGYKKTAISQCIEALSNKIIVLCTLEEIVHLLENKSD